MHVVLDDFGADEASLSLLRRFPLSAVKIDRSLMHGVPRLSHETGLAHALIQLAQSLRLEVLVEGVENEAQRQFLADAGCSAWQGFLFAPPLDALRSGTPGAGGSTRAGRQRRGPSSCRCAGRPDGRLDSAQGRSMNSSGTLGRQPP